MKTIEKASRRTFLAEMRELHEYLTNRPDPRGAAIVRRAYRELTGSDLQQDGGS